MNNKKKFLSRITRRKDSAPAKPDEGYELPPPTAIEPGVPYSAEDAEGKSYGSHMELDLLAADEPSRADSTYGVDARESAPAPALELEPTPILDEPRDTPEPQSEAVLYEEYGLDLEPLTEIKSEASPDAPEPVQEEDESVSLVAESTVDANTPEQEFSEESDPAPAENIAQEVEEHLVASVMQESQVESPEASLAENGIFPLVRDVRGAWRSGKGFSRSELQAAGLSLAEAASLHIRVDKRRRNAHPVNVAALEKAKSGV